MWYAVYRRSTRQLAYGGAGHPPLLLRTGGAPLKQLMPQNPAIGMMSDMPYDAEMGDLGPSAQLYLFSRGGFEGERPGGTMWKFDEFVQFMGTLPEDESGLDRVLREARSLHGQDVLADDFSLVQVIFDA